jgi:hypothetical protein
VAEEKPPNMQHPLTHEGAEPDKGHDTHAIADQRATVLQPDGEVVKDSADQVDADPPPEP